MTDAVTFLTPRGYELMKDAMDEADIRETKQDLTVTPITPPTNPAPPKSFPIYRETSTRLIVPRHYGFDNFGDPDECSISNGTSVRIPFNGELRDYQNKIIDTYVDYVTDKKNHGGHDGGGGLISVGCGQGKTVMALNIVSRLSQKTLVVVHKEFLLNQWVERIQQFLPSARVGRIQGKILDTQNKDIVIGMLQSLSMKDYPESLFSQFGFTIIDECFPPETKVVTTQGTLSIQELYTDWDTEKTLPLIMSYSRLTDTYEWRPMTYAWERTKEKLVKVVYTLINDTQQQEYSFDCTPTHKILIHYGLPISGDEEFRKRHMTYIDQTNKEDKYASTLYIQACELTQGDCIMGCRVEQGGCSIPSTEHYIVKEVVYYPEQTDNPYIVYDIEVGTNHNFVILPHETTTDTELADVPNPSIPLHGLTVSNCHHIGAEVFSRSLFKMVTKYMLGLSATLKRKDGLTNVFKMFLGDVVYEMKRKVDLDQKEEDRVLIRAIQYHTTNEAFNRTELNFKGQLNYAVMIRKLCEYSQRTEFVLNVIYDLLKENKHHQIMVLAHNKSVLKYIYQAIQKRQWASVGYYLGGMKEKDLKESETKRVVIATYAMAEEALDIKTLTTLVMVTPKTTVEQAVGRILRSKHEHARPIVVDMTDTHDVFKNQWKKRHAYYKKNGYEILTTTSTLYDNARNKVYTTNKPSRLIQPPFHKHPDKEIREIWSPFGQRRKASVSTSSKSKPSKPSTRSTPSHESSHEITHYMDYMGVNVNDIRGGEFTDTTTKDAIHMGKCLISVSTEELQDICMNAYR